MINRLQILFDTHAEGKHTVFADKCKIPRSTMQNYKTGRMPSAEHLIRIRETFNVDLNWLLTGEGSAIYHQDKEINALLKKAVHIMTADSPHRFLLPFAIQGIFNLIEDPVKAELEELKKWKDTVESRLFTDAEKATG